MTLARLQDEKFEVLRPEEVVRVKMNLEKYNIMELATFANLLEKTAQAIEHGLGMCDYCSMPLPEKAKTHMNRADETLTVVRDEMTDRMQDVLEMPRITMDELFGDWVALSKRVQEVQQAEKAAQFQSVFGQPNPNGGN